MSILLIRSLNKFRQNYQIASIIKLTSRPLATSPFVQQKVKSQSAVTTSNSSDRTDVSTDVRPLGERIKENTKTASYFGVIVLGIGVTGIVAFVVFRELFSSSSPNNVYSDGLKECVNVSSGLILCFEPSQLSILLVYWFQDTRIQDALGVPIKGYGEETRRRRRQHVAHSIYQRNGKQYIRMQFYIQGIRNKATVHLEKELVSHLFIFI